MKKRKNIILSAITCFVSICMLMFGVYAASSPSVSLNGQVSYTARDASVLVQGKTNNDGTAIIHTSTPATKADLLALGTEAKKNTTQEYFDWTQGEKSGNSDDATETLQNWTLGTIEIKEDNSGIKPVKLDFKITNYSNYPIKVTIDFTTLLTDEQLASANLKRTVTGLTNGKTYLSEVGASGATTTIQIAYDVVDSSKKVQGENLLGMKLSFAKNQDKILTFESNGGSDVSMLNYDGTAFSTLPTPTKSNNEFLGWYLDEALTNQVEYPFAPTTSMTLYAKWLEVCEYTISVCSGYDQHDMTVTYTSLDGVVHENVSMQTSGAGSSYSSTAGKFKAKNGTFVSITFGFYVSSINSYNQENVTNFEQTSYGVSFVLNGGNVDFDFSLAD